MSFTVDYANHSDKETQALEDIKFYLGEEGFEKKTELFKENNLSKGQFEIYASFAGVRGYPVQVWFKHCYPDKEWV